MIPPCSHSSWVSDWLREPSTTSLVTQLLGSCVCSPVPPPCSHSSWVSDWLREAQYHLPGHTAPGFYSDCMGTRAKYHLIVHTAPRFYSDCMGTRAQYTSLFTQLLGSSNWYNTLSRAQWASRAAQELCESRGGRPGLPSLISLRFLWT